MPELFDGSRLLADFYEYNSEIKIAEKILQSAVGIVRTYFPKNFSPVKDKTPWSWVDNRPFLRLFLDYAMFVERTQKTSRAKPLYEEMLLLNPNDNQGVRSLLSTCYFKLNLPEKVLELAKKYPTDITPEITMGRILALIKLNQKGQAVKRIEKDKKWIKHLVKELLKKSHPQPKDLHPDRVTVGGQDEAYYYWQDQGVFWQTTKGSLDLLKKLSE